MPTSSASAVWEGVLKNGRGHFRAGSGAFEGDYSFATRFENARGTNPEELIAAAHAACLSMALSAGLEKGGTPATRISTKASCTVDKVGDGFKITRMRLEVRGKVPGLDQGRFVKAAEAAKNGCPVSTALQGNVQFELDARLEEMEPVRSGRG
jgi:osmotically inducible protein OsmC